MIYSNFGEFMSSYMYAVGMYAIVNAFVPNVTKKLSVYELVGLIPFVVIVDMVFKLLGWK